MENNNFLKAADAYLSGEFIGRNLREEVRKAYATGTEKAYMAAGEIISELCQDEEVYERYMNELYERIC